MRILASNPDTIGDVVLRQPMYQAFMDAGHELMLAVRPLLLPVVTSIVPGARVVAISANVYDPRMTPEDPALDEVVAAAREFDPDVYVVAPYQWTVLSERLSIELDRARVVALSGRLFFDPQFGPAPESRLRVTDLVQVAEETPEVRKNELMAGEVLGRAMTLPDPKLQAAPAHTAVADALLSRLGLEADGYLVACVGDSQWTRIRNWQPERWGEVLKHWALEYGRKFLLIGNKDEAETAAKVREAMGDQAGAASEWAGGNDGDLDVLLGLIARSRGYIGRDTGPMHIGAAMGKPVLAIFGGGTWPRFLPQVDPSVSFSVGVPCAGCNWVCHLPTSYCIKEVPVGEVLKAIDELESGKLTRRTTRNMRADEMLLSRIGREGAVWGRAHLTQLSHSRRAIMEQTQTMTENQERANKEIRRADALAGELEALRHEMNRRETLLRQRLAATESLYRSREAEMQARVEECERIVADAERHLRAKIEIELRRAIAVEEADRAKREADLRSRHAKAAAELTEAQAQVADLQIRLERVLGEHAALAKWSRQIEQEVEVLRPRLYELMSSRWRRYGQRLHLCMTLPWEKELTSSNGKH